MDLVAQPNHGANNGRFMGWLAPHSGAQTFAMLLVAFVVGVASTVVFFRVRENSSSRAGYERL